MAEAVSTLLLFGATGDLARRMLLPSLYALDLDGLLPSSMKAVELQEMRGGGDAAFQLIYVHNV